MFKTSLLLLNFCLCVYIVNWFSVITLRLCIFANGVLLSFPFHDDTNNIKLYHLSSLGFSAKIAYWYLGNLGNILQSYGCIFKCIFIQIKVA